MSINNVVLPAVRLPDSPLSIHDYLKNGGYQALQKVVTMSDGDILDEMLNANLNGRGGASYLAGRKWNQLWNLKGEKHSKYIVCNADEGEPGTFKDRDILMYNPISVIEGMTIAAKLFQAKRGFIYIRGEYRTIHKRFQTALDICRGAGYLGNSIMGYDDFDFDIQIVSGAGSYECGESSALLNSIDGKAGRPRIKPPHLAEVGLYGQPTLVNNVESYANVPVIFRIGSSAYKEMGVENDGGTRVIAICGHAKNRGTYEVNVGTTIGEIVNNPDLGGGAAGKHEVKFVQIGGHSGAIAFPEQFETHCDYNNMKSEGLAIGAGSFVVMNETVCLVDYCRKVMEFFVHESCGKCTPCRIGTAQALALLTDMCQGRGKPGDVEKLESLVHNISALSACGLGQAVNKAIDSCLAHRREEFQAHCTGNCPSNSCSIHGGEQ